MKGAGAWKGVAACGVTAIGGRDRSPGKLGNLALKARAFAEFRLNLRKQVLGALGANLNSWLFIVHSVANRFCLAE